MKWLRTIDSAQRRIEVSQPRGSGSVPDKVVFHIQGISLYRGEVQEDFLWVDMVDQGINFKGEKPLSLMARLMRKEARVGSLNFRGDGSLEAVWWSKPELVLSFDLNDPDEADLWRECEIMALSAGFHFRVKQKGIAFKQEASFKP